MMIKLFFSTIGYESRIISRSDFTSVSLETIELKRKMYSIPTVEILGKRAESFKLGRSQTTKITTGHSGNSNYGVGREWGLKIRYPNSPYYIKKVHFNTRFNTVDSVLFRINIYNIDDFGMPAKSLVSKTTYVKSYRKDKWIEADILDQAILVSEDIIVTFETVRIWYRSKGKNHLFFTHGKGYEERKTYTRESSHDKWYINRSQPIAMYVTGIKKVE